MNSLFFPDFFMRRKFARDTGNIYQTPSQLDLGEIIEVYPKKKFRVDVRLFSTGKILEDIRIPSPFYDKDGNLHGQKSIYAKNQLVLIGYIHGRAEAPLIIQHYSFPSGDINQDNIDNIKENYDPNTYELGHKSGHRLVLDANKQSVMDSNNEAVFEIDFSKKEIRIKDGWQLKIADQVKIDNAGISIQTGNIEIENGDVTVQKAIKPITQSTHTHQTSQGPTSTPN